MSLTRGTLYFFYVWLQIAYKNSENAEKNNFLEKVITQKPENNLFVTQGYSYLIRDGAELLVLTVAPSSSN